MATNKPKAGHSLIVLVLIAFLGGAALGGLAVHFFKGTDGSPAQTERPIKKGNKVTAVGRLEPEGGVVNLGVPIPDRLQEILPGIHEEAVVKIDQPLARMESFSAHKLNV